MHKDHYDNGTEIPTVEVKLRLAQYQAEEIITGLVWRYKQKGMSESSVRWITSLAMSLDAEFFATRAIKDKVAEGLLAQKRVIRVGAK